MATGMLAPEKRLGARPMMASNRSDSTMLAAYFALGATPEQDAVGHDHADHALGIGDAEHVHQKGQVTPGLGRDCTVAVKAMMGVVGREFVAPVLQAEGRIGDDAVVGEEATRRVHEAWFGNDVAGFKASGPETVKQEVELADGQGAQVALLAVEGKIAVSVRPAPARIGLRR